MAEMSFAEYNDMVKTIPPDRTDEPLRISVLPWRTWRNRPIPYAHCAKPPDDDSAINAIPITNDIPWRLLPTVISRAIALDQSARSIARLLGRSPSSVSREISRNGGYDRYRAAPADEPQSVDARS